ncbi:MAG: hypothetical protein LQ345_005237 [Seirophora villosa]|nr:MAG: hypothetical protein LQ345_005237 [Seirophora villosa]
MESSLSVASGMANQSFNQFLAGVPAPVVATYQGLDPDQDCADEMWNIDVSDPSRPSWPCAFVEQQEKRKRRVAHRRPAPFPYAVSYSAIYQKDGNGYNITLPGQLCADAVVGDFLSPGGRMYRNASLATVHNALSQLSPIALRSFMTRTLRRALLRLEDALQPYICKPSSGNERELLFRYSATDRSGFCCYATLVFSLGMGAWMGTMYVPLASPDFAANWTGNAVFGLASFGMALIFTLQIVMVRLQQSELRLSTMEANTLNFFIAASELVWKSLKASGRGVCYVAAALWAAVPDLCAQSRQPGLQAPGPGPNAGGGNPGANPNELEQVVIDICPAPGT